MIVSYRRSLRAFLQVSFLICLSIQSLGATDYPEDFLLSKRIYAHMTIKDYTSAAHEACSGIHQHPHSKSLWQAYLKALAKSGDEKVLMINWNLYRKRFPDDSENRELLECLAWAIIENGATSSAPITRVTAMLGAFFSQDAKGIAILQKGLTDQNTFIRAAAVKLASHLHDETLQDAILTLLNTEKAWHVRLEAIEALGKFRLTTARPYLMDVINQDHLHIEEQLAAIQSLVEIADKIDPEQIKKLVQHNRAGMRLLACEFVAHFQQNEDVDLLFPLLTDYHADVRAKVFEVLGRLRNQTIAGYSVAELALKGTSDADPLVAVTATWTLLLNHQQQGLEVFETLFKHHEVEVRYLSASALAASGKYGLPLALKIFHHEDDPYIKMNLAIGLIGQRTEVIASCDSLYHSLTKQKEKWAWQTKGNFKILAPSKLKHDDTIPNYPEAVNQLTRLQILEMLAVVRYPEAQKAIKNFLQESKWGITGMASALLLTEGDEEAVDLVKTLLNDEDSKIKMQAALIIALWGKGEESIALLQSAYPTADRELKGQILEGIGRIGSRTSLSFLANCLQEPYPTLRIIAAAALLECLYH